MTIFEVLKAAHHPGLALDDLHLLELDQQTNNYIEVFTRGDPQIQESHQKMYQTEGGSSVLKQHGVDLSQEVFEYMAKAMGAAKAQS